MIMMWAIAIGHGKNGSAYQTGLCIGKPLIRRSLLPRDVKEAYSIAGEYSMMEVKEV